MRKLASFFVLFGMCAMPAFAAVEAYQDVSVVDVNCSTKVAAEPDSHTRACALKVCSKWFRHRHPGQALPEVRCGGQHKNRRSSQSV